MLKQLVLDRIAQLGAKDAKDFFGVSAGTISNWASGKTEPSIAAAELVLDGQVGQLQPESEDLVSWDGKKVIILQPVYRTINPDTHFTLFANYAKYGPEKLGLIQEHRTVIYEARNILVHKFLKNPAAEYAIMVDDDMILPCGNAALFNSKYKAGVPDAIAGQVAISRLMSHGPDKEIVGALYFGRHDEGKSQCCVGFESSVENEKLRKHAHTGLVRTDWVGTGLVRIHRSVFEKMRAEIDAGRWPDSAPVGPDGGWYGFFTPFRVRMGEDVAFGRRAKELGIQSYVDAGLVCMHAGETRYGPRNTKG